MLEILLQRKERVKKHLDTKVRKFQTQLKDLTNAKQLISENINFVIGGIQVSEISPKYLLRQILHRPTVSYNVYQ